MKRTELVALAVGIILGLAAVWGLGAPAYAQSSSVPNPYWQENQFPTHPPPTDAGQGLEMYGLRGWRLSVCAPDNHTWIAGDGGTVEAYLYDYRRAGWQKSSSNLTETLSHTNVSCAASDGGRIGCRCQVFEDREASVSTGRVYYAVRGGRLVDVDAGLGQDGGQNFQVQIQGTKR